MVARTHVAELARSARVRTLHPRWRDSNRHVLLLNPLDPLRHGVPALLLEMHDEHSPGTRIAVDVQDLRPRDAQPHHVGVDLLPMLLVGPHQTAEPFLADRLDLEDPAGLPEDAVTAAAHVEFRHVDLHFRLEVGNARVQHALHPFVDAVTELKDRHQIHRITRNRRHRNAVVVERAVTRAAEG